VTPEEIAAWREQHGRSIAGWFVALRKAGFRVVDPRKRAGPINFNWKPPMVSIARDAPPAPHAFVDYLCRDAERDCPPCPIGAQDLVVFGMVVFTGAHANGTAWFAYYDFTVPRAAP